MSHDFSFDLEVTFKKFTVKLRAACVSTTIKFCKEARDRMLPTDNRTIKRDYNTVRIKDTGNRLHQGVDLVIAEVVEHTKKQHNVKPSIVFKRRIVDVNAVETSFVAESGTCLVDVLGIVVNPQVGDIIKFCEDRGGATTNVENTLSVSRSDY